jgi:hypothetical protein
MRHTPFTPLRTTFSAPIVLAGLIFLAACSTTLAPSPATPTPAVSDLATSTPTLEIVATPASQGDERLESVSPTPTEPAPTQPIPTTAPVANSPLPSPTPAAVEPSPTIAEAVSGGPAPDFTLEGAQGEVITLSDYQDRANVLLVFYQGKT